MSEATQPRPPTWRDYEYLASRLTHVIQANTNTLRLVHATQVRITQAIDEVRVESSSHHAASSSSADHVDGKIDVIIDQLRDSRSNLRDALSELRVVSERLGLTREELSEFRRDQTPQSVPIYTPRREEDDGKSPPEGITVRHGRVSAVIGVSTITGAAWRGARRAAPWAATTGIGAAITHLLHRLHLFGL